MKWPILTIRQLGFFVLCIIPILVVSILFLTRDPLVWPDEATMTDIAKTYQSGGVIATNLPGNLVPGLSERAFIYPPVYFPVLAGWMGLFGPSIESIRSLSLVISIAVLAAGYLLMRLFLQSDWWAAFATFVLSLDMGFGRSARFGRMEMLVELWFMLSVYLYLTAVKSSSAARLLASGVFAGLAVTTHPVGIAIVAILGLTHLLLRKPVKSLISDAFLFISPPILFISLWILSNIHYLNYLFIQLSYQFADKNNYGPYLGQLFREPQTVLLILTYIAGLLLFFASAKKIPKLHVVVISIGLIVMTALQLAGKIQWYLLYLQPWYLSAVTLGAYHAKTLFKGITVAYFFVLIFASLWIYMDIFKSANVLPNAYHSFTTDISRRLPPKSSVLLTTIPDPYFDLSKRSDLKLTEFSTGPIPLASYEASMDSIDIVVVNFIPIDWFRLYVEKNKQVVIPIRQKQNGYETNIVILKPVDQRVSVIE